MLECAWCSVPGCVGMLQGCVCISFEQFSGCASVVPYDHVFNGYGVPCGYFLYPLLPSHRGVNEFGGIVS